MRNEKYKTHNIRIEIPNLCETTRGDPARSVGVDLFFFFFFALANNIIYSACIYLWVRARVWFCGGICVYLVIRKATKHVEPVEDANDDACQVWRVRAAR